MKLSSMDIVWFSMFRHYPGGGWVDEIGNKANSAEAEDEGDIVFLG